MKVKLIHQNTVYLIRIGFHQINPNQPFRVGEGTSQRRKRQIELGDTNFGEIDDSDHTKISLFIGENVFLPIQA
jgi:hypothetical protein